MIGHYNISDDGSKTMAFRCGDEESLKAYKKVFKDISSKIDKKLNNEPTFKASNNTYLKKK